MEYPKVRIDVWDYKDGHYCSGGKKWSNARMLKLAEGKPVVEIPLCALPRWYWPWEDNMTLELFIEHMNRVKNADLDNPILIAPHGGIIDGMHRICKAILEGQTTIKAVVFDSMPAPDGADD